MARMRPVRLLLIYLAAIFAGGALLAPWVFDLTKGFAAFPFHRVLDRCLLGIALVGLWPLLRACNLWSCRQLGLTTTITAEAPAKRIFRHTAFGFLGGFGSLLVVFATAVLCGGRQVSFVHVSAGTILGAVAAAIIVSVLEEILFRGGFFGILRQVWDWRSAALASAVIYALGHFLQKTDLPGPVTWLSGFQSLPEMFAPLANIQTAAPMFFNLTLVGCILAVAYQRTGALFASMGLHAGWIFWLRLFRLATTPAPGAAAWLWGTDQLLDAWILAPALGVVLFFVARIKPAKSDA